MRLTNVRLLVNDFGACVSFYRDVLGLPLRTEVPGDVYAEFDAGGTLLGLYRDDLMANVLEAEAPTGASAEDAAVLSFEVDDVDATYAELVNRGAAPAGEPHDETAWFMRVAYVRDPDGNLIEIYRPIG